MTDYLTRLAKRTLGLLPVAQPLITPSFSSFTSRMNDRPEISFNDNIALFDQQVIPGAQEKEAPQAFSQLRSKAQNTAQSGNDLSSGKTEHYVDGNANNSLLSHKKIGADNQDQRHPEPDFIRQNSRLIPQSVHIEKQLPSKDTGILAEKKYGEQESVTLSDQTPKYPKNSSHRRNPEMMGPKIEKEMMGSRIEKEMKDIDIADPMSVSKSLAYPFSEKYGTNKKSNPDYPGTSDILHDPEKLVSNDPPPGRGPWFSEKDRYIAMNQENYEMNRKTGSKNVIDPVIKISPEGKGNIIRDIHTKIQQPPIPTIKVTIGRVEVRAVPPQPILNPSPAMKKPALSLDEYLKQHNG